MNSPPIRFSTDILRRLGEELNPNLDQGILELVKNSYDANARRCAVRFRNVINPGGEIEIDDDGDGLEYQDIVDGLASSRAITKKHERNPPRSNAGRRQRPWPTGCAATRRTGTPDYAATRVNRR
jgi:hypothetical protein